MSNILLIETATSSCSVALSFNEKIIAFKEQTAQNIHASQITLFIADVLKQAGIDFKNIDAVAVSKGPGSYTGLRIGVSTAKGLCYALDKPLISVDTLQAMASGVASRYTNELLCPMIDARRMEVYTAVYDVKLNQIKETKAVILDEQSFAHLDHENKLVFFGDGSSKCKTLFSNNPTILFDEITNSARYMAGLAYQKFKLEEFENTAYFEPYYLKEFIAIKQKPLI